MTAQTFTGDLEAGNAPTDVQEPEYTFEGFQIEFSDKVMLTPVAPNRTVQVKSQLVSKQFTLDPDRAGTFLICDIYPHDFKNSPPFHLLPGLNVAGKEVVGCVVKASQGTGWGKAYEDWFKASWQKIREVVGDRYGVDFFRGCYHYLQFLLDGAKQADYMCDLVDAAGGWGDGDLMPWVDIEEADQGKWAPQQLEKITDAGLRQRLADSVTACATSFISRFKQRTGLRIAVYGRGVFRDLQMTDCKFGSDGSVNPAHTVTMPRMEKYGVPLDDIILWQIGGDHGPANPGFPKSLGAWGTHDYSVYIDGARSTNLKTLRSRCLARPQ
jgi:hypothetical protein